MKKLEKRNIKNINIIREYVYKNIKLYLIASIVLLIGVIFGVVVANNLKVENKNESMVSFNNCINNIKEGYKIENRELLQMTLYRNIIYVIIVWFMGCSVIGLPIVYMLLMYKGFSLAYTMSSIIYEFGIDKGSIISIILFFIQYLIIIPAILTLSVSGMNLYKSIMKNKKMENIKIQIIKHTIFSIIMLCIIVVATIAQTYVSTPIFVEYVKNFL